MLRSPGLPADDGRQGGDEQQGEHAEDDEDDDRGAVAGVGGAVAAAPSGPAEAEPERGEGHQHHPGDHDHLQQHGDTNTMKDRIACARVAFTTPDPDGAPRPPRLVGVLRIDRATYDAIVAHAREDHPDEACGVVAGPEGSDRPERFIPMLNAARSPTFYEFDSGDLLRLYREMDDRDEEPVVIYHSHTATEAYPSRTDISFAGEPGAHYLLVSTRESDSEEIRSFRIVDGVVTEEEINIVDATVDA